MIKITTSKQLSIKSLNKYLSFLKHKNKTKSYDHFEGEIENIMKHKQEVKEEERKKEKKTLISARKYVVLCKDILILVCPHTQTYFPAHIFPS